jgi:hypothetical protein
LTSDIRGSKQQTRQVEDMVKNSLFFIEIISFSLSVTSHCGKRVDDGFGKRRGQASA